MKLYNFFLLILLTNNLFSQITKEHCEDWILKSLSTQDDSIKIYILDSIKEIPLKKFYSEIKKISLITKNDNLKLKSLYVLYEVYKDTTALSKMINFLLEKPKITEDSSALAKAKFYLKNQLRAETAQMLGKIGDERVINVLSKIINDEEEDGNVKDAAYFAIALLSQRGKIRPLDEMKEFFYSGLKDVNPKVRLQAVKYIGELKYEDAVGPLSLRLKDTNKQVIIETIRSLGKIGDIKLIEELIKFRSHPEDNFRVTLAEALGNILESINNSTDTIKIEISFKIKNVLNSLLNDPNGMVRVVAAKSLLSAKDNSGVAILKKGLESADIDVVLYCIETFGKYGNMEDVKTLEKFLEHPDIKIKTASYINLLKIFLRNKS